MKAILLQSTLYAAEDAWKKAAFALNSYRFENYRGCSATAAQKLDWFVNTAEYWLEDGETGSASQAVRYLLALSAVPTTMHPLCLRSLLRSRKATASSTKSRVTMPWCCASELATPVCLTQSANFSRQHSTTRNCLRWQVTHRGTAGFPWILSLTTAVLLPSQDLAW